MITEENSAASSLVTSETSSPVDEKVDQEAEENSIFTWPNGVGLGIIFMLLIFRLFNGLIVRTFFSPDEFFQSLEIAHNYVFGTGYITWEWRPQSAVRSFFHPFVLYVPVYWLARLIEQAAASGEGRVSNLLAALMSNLGKDENVGNWLLKISGGASGLAYLIVLYGPKLVNGLLAFFHDFFLILFAQEFERINHGRVSPTSFGWILFCTLSSWFNFYSLPRSFSNSIETVITPLAWYLLLRANRISSAYNSQDQKADSRPLSPFKIEMAFVLSIAIGCLFRPTFALFWLYPVLFVFIPDEKRWIKRIGLLLIIGIMALFLQIGLIDFLFYGRLTSTLLNFFQFNVVNSLSLFYGSNSWHWYFSQGVAVIATVHLPLSLVGAQCLGKSRNCGCSSSDSQLKKLLYAPLSSALVSVVLFSFLGHKEFRFIHPILPIILVYAAKGASHLSGSCTNDTSRSRVIWKRFLLVSLILLVNVPLSLYMSLYHQSGVIKVVHEIRRRYYTHNDLHHGNEQYRGFFLMPCHSTPLFSHIHPLSPITSDSSESDSRVSIFKMPSNTNSSNNRKKTIFNVITCEPPINLPSNSKANSIHNYMDESDIFYLDPETFIRDHFDDGNEDDRFHWPDYFVLFEHLEPIVSSLLRHRSYSKCYETFNSHFNDDKRRRGKVLIYCRAH